MVTSRTSTGVFLPASVATQVWADAQNSSAVMRLSNRLAIPGNGVSVPMITSDAEAAWVAEGAEKPVEDANLGNKMVTPYKLAVIQVFTDEFRRDSSALYDALAARLPGALARKFDETVFGGTAPGSGFDVLSDVDQVVAVGGTDVYADLLTARGDIAAANGVMDGIVVSPAGANALLGATDTLGRPLLVPDTSSASLGLVLGANIVESRNIDAVTTPATLGFAGDWSSAYYGTVEGIQISMSDQATLTGFGNLWQRNAFAVRAEVEIAFAVRDKDRFVRLTA